jgi:hypothetical protein
MITKIVVALDGSKLAEQVLPYVTQIGSITGAKVVLMTSITPVTPWELSRLVAPLNGEEDAATDYLEGQRLLLAKRRIDSLGIALTRKRVSQKEVVLSAPHGCELRPTRIARSEEVSGGQPGALRRIVAASDLRSDGKEQLIERTPCEKVPRQLRAALQQHQMSARVRVDADRRG